MQPYYRRNNVTLYNANCHDILPLLETSSIGACVTDPPYMTTDLHFDKDGVSMRWIKDLIRIVNGNGYLALFAPVEMQAEIAKIWSMRFSGAWVKEKGGPRTASAKKPKNQWELYCVFAHPNHKISSLAWNKICLPGKPYRKIQHNSGHRRGGKDQLDRASTSAWTEEGYIASNDGTREQTDVIYAPMKGGMKHNERTSHPTQKPLKCMSTLVRWLTNPNDFVLDPFVGSGTTAIACIRQGRKFIGIEVNQDYINMAIERIDRELSQPKLLTTTEMTTSQSEQKALF